MSNLVEFEPYVDSTIRVLIRQLEEARPDQDQGVDLGKWLQWFALDVMGEITFSRRLGFLDEAKDVDGITQKVLSLFKYASWVCTHVFGSTPPPRPRAPPNILFKIRRFG
jgi:hypothetical protein